MFTLWNIRVLLYKFFQFLLYISFLLLYVFPLKVTETLTLWEKYVLYVFTHWQRV